MNQSIRPFVLCLLLLPFARAGAADDGVQSFDKDPGWEKFGEKTAGAPIKITRQDFGWRPTHKAGGAAAGGGRGAINPFAPPAPDCAPGAAPGLHSQTPGFRRV